MDLANASIYTNMDGLTALKARAVKDSKGSLDEVARQFESLFVQQMLKGMRQTSLGEGLMDSDQSLFYRDMYDQQLAINLSESGGIGLAKVIKQQLGGTSDTTGSNPVLPVKSIQDYRRLAMAMKLYHGVVDGNRKSAVVAQPTPAKAVAASDKDSASDPQAWTPEEFVGKLWPWAKEAAGLLGLKPQALLAQAALETGWGKRLIRAADGTSSNNLFGIKADHHWQGDRVSVPTVEYAQGTAEKRTEAFRAYDSLRESFRDYVDFLRSNPRYEQALDSAADTTDYFNELQRAGYATDPEYANKINAVLNGSEMNRAVEKLKLQADQSI